MRWYIVIMLSTHFFMFRHLRIFAHQKDKNNYCCPINLINLILKLGLIPLQESALYRYFGVTTSLNSHE